MAAELEETARERGAITDPLRCGRMRSRMRKQEPPVSLKLPSQNSHSIGYLRLLNLISLPHSPLYPPALPAPLNPSSHPTGERRSRRARSALPQRCAGRARSSRRVRSLRAAIRPRGALFFVQRRRGGADAALPVRGGRPRRRLQARGGLARGPRFERRGRGVPGGSPRASAQTRRDGVSGGAVCSHEGDVRGGNAQKSGHSSSGICILNFCSGNAALINPPSAAAALRPVPEDLV